MREFAESGTYQFLVPAGVTHLLFEGWGAGGGIGSQPPESMGPGGGGGGGYARGVVIVTPGETVMIVVGAAGDQGANGGDSKIMRTDGTVLISAGGGLVGGQGDPCTDGPSQPGLGGTGGQANVEAAIRRMGNSGFAGTSCAPIESFDCHPCSANPLETCCSVIRVGWTNGAPGASAPRLPVGSIAPLGGGGIERGYVMLTW